MKVQKPPLDPLAQSFCEMMESMGYKFVEAKVVKAKKKKKRACKANVELLK